MAVEDNDDNLFVASIINENNVAKISHKMVTMATTNGYEFNQKVK